MKASSNLPCRPRPAGFTLLELIITLTLAGILAALAAPSFRNLIAGQRIRTASFDLVSHLTLARSEAIKRNGNVTVASTSLTNAWETGWKISSAGDTIKQQGAYSNLTITTGAGGPASLTYNRSGRLASTNAINFQITDPSAGNDSQSRCITIGPTGQPTSKQGSC